MDEALIKRVPPHSIEAEQSVVGAMLMDRDAITVAAEIICGDDFYQKAYGVIFDSVVELFNEGKPVDLITLQNRLREKAVPEEISSLEFVRDLVTAVPTSANVKYYAEIVSEKATLRRLIKMNEAIADECYQGQEPLKAIGERGGVIGLNYYAYFLRDWKDGETVVSRAEDIVAHAKYIRDMAGIEALGLGSDFDGMNGELEIASPADMEKLEEVFKKNGFAESEIEKIFYKNVMRIYREMLG